MSHFGSLSSHFPLDAGFQSCTQASIRLNTKMIHPYCFLPFFWLVLTDFLVVQSMHTRLQKSNFGLVVRLKFQIAWYVC
jgi:hypothetical protein